MTKRDVFLLIVVLAVLIALAMVIDFFNKPEEEIKSEEKTMEEILQSLTAPPEGEGTEVSAQILKSLSAPEKGEVPSEDILKSLTAPQ
ncbi:MAG: hypothetical protein Q8P63_00440 [Candidatus Nealsonbacteria bacterium]|nr:hypothetical protein [Candidatus Nealsonbacteria bacterium]